MPAPSIHSAAGTLGGIARKMSMFSSPDMKIVLDNHTDGKIYTTLDAISGRVEITSPLTVRFDEIRINLEGIVRVYVENMSPASTRARTTAVHNFLRLNMPIRESDYPQPRIFESGRTYTFPFNFVIPEQLLPRSCQHEELVPHIQQAHLQLPPSMGDKELIGKDDMTPEMARVFYGIRGRVIKNMEEEDDKLIIVERVKKIHVVPAQAEAPPMTLDKHDHFKLSKTKTLRKGVFSGRLGSITVSTEQTGALMLPPPSEGSTTPASTVATVNLRFDPRDGNSQPPKLGGLTTKIKTFTFFSVRATNDLPVSNGNNIVFDPFRGVYESNMNVNSRCVENVTWTKVVAPLRRKNSNSSTSSSDLSDENTTPEPEGRGFFYTAKILVPISLPSSKNWIPGFHSCIASRVYQLDLSLGVHTMGPSLPSNSVTLHLPIQIGATGSGATRATLTPAEAAAELADAEEFLRPRVIEVPREEHLGHSVLVGHNDLPPSYDFAPSARQAVF